MNEEEEPKEDSKGHDTLIDNHILPMVRLRKIDRLEDNVILEITSCGYDMKQTKKLFDHVLIRLLYDLEKKKPPKDSKNPLTG